MPNRTYLDLTNDIMRYESEGLNVANRYESVQQTLNTADVDPIIREAIFYSMYNAKSWYTAYAHAAASESLSATFMDSGELYNGLIDKLDYWLSKTDNLLNLLLTVSAQSTSYGGYRFRFQDGENNLYEQLRLIDSVYGSSVSSNRTSFDTLVELENLNTRVEDLHSRFRSLDLPYQLMQSKTTEQIDYTKLRTTIVGLDNNRVVNIPFTDFSEKNKRTSLILPALQEGQYMLQIENQGEVSLVDTFGSTGGWYEIQTNRQANFDGGILAEIVNGNDTGVRYPVIKSERIAGFRYKIYIGVPNQNIDECVLRENYINPVSLILDVKTNTDQAIYDFFYGSYMDEFKEVLPNGNHVYKRLIKDKNGNVKAAYRLILDFTTKTEQGMPKIEYQRIN